jgi:hypothetical protein
MILGVPKTQQYEVRRISAYGVVIAENVKMEMKRKKTHSKWRGRG